MVFNKTKRTTEKVSAILSVVGYSIRIILCLVLIGAGVYFLTHEVALREIYDPYYSSSYYDGYWHYYGGYVTEYGIDYVIALGYLIPGIIELAITVVGLILSIQLIKSPIKADGSLAKCTGKRVTLLVFSILTSNIVGVVLWIIVLCMKDFVPEVVQSQNTSASNNVQPQGSANISISLDAKIAKLKEFKELGIITDAVYNKAIAKLITDASEIE